MASTFLTQICIALIILLLLLLIQGRGLFTHRTLLALFFVVYFADNVIIVLTNRFSSLQLIPNHVWEGFLVCSWSGKLYSIVFAVALLYLCRRVLGRDDAGLTIHQNPGSFVPACIVILLLSAWAFYVGISSPDGMPDLQTLLYLAVMPGLNEELIYRGFLLGALNKIMPGRIALWAAPFGWGAVVTSLLFGLLHGFWIDSNLAVHLEMIAFRNAAISGFIFSWLRERTGSLLMPVVAHGLEDFFFFFPRMF